MPLCAGGATNYLSLMKADFDIFVSGGGIAGLTASAAFGAAGYRVLCVDPAAPVLSREATGADLRTTAILQPGRDLLREIGLWDRLSAHATPLEIMRIIDAGGPDAVPRSVKDFRANDISNEPFGWNLPNWLLRREIMAHLSEMENVTFQAGQSATGFWGRGSVARVRLGQGGQITAKLVIAADGRNSAIREAARISVRQTRYGQKALAFAVTHDLPHENISTEIHRTGGPFTLVPLPDHEGRPSSAIVWMDDGPEQARRHALDDASFEAEMQERSCHVLGTLKLASRRTLWPIISQRADRMTGPRLALIAEAAHVVPPIGAQGLNMSLQDITVLLSLLQNKSDPGAQDILQAFERARMPDIRMRVGGIDILNRASQVRLPLLRDARAKALDALYGLTPLRDEVMKLGLGLR